MGIETTNFDSETEEQAIEPSSETEVGDTGDEMEIWGYHRADLLEEIMGGNIENNSGYDTPKGVMDISDQQFDVGARSSVDIDHPTGEEPTPPSFGRQNGRYVSTRGNEWEDFDGEVEGYSLGMEIGGRVGLR